MLWKLFRSDDRVMEALEQSTGGADISPGARQYVPANDLPAGAERRSKSRLWLEDWSEKDERRLKHSDHVWEGYVS